MLSCQEQLNDEKYNEAIVRHFSAFHIPPRFWVRLEVAASCAPGKTKEDSGAFLGGHWAIPNMIVHYVLYKRKVSLLANQFFGKQDFHPFTEVNFNLKC